MSIWRKVGKGLTRGALAIGAIEVTKRLARKTAQRRTDNPTQPKPRPPKNPKPRPVVPGQADHKTPLTAGQPQVTPTKPASTKPAAGYLGDFTGSITPRYDPYPDGDPDPGEVVWAWVPYEEDHSRGKDRPVLVIARHNGTLLALALTSKDHDRDAASELRAGRHWQDVGTGAWDRKRRPSEVRLDRVLQLRYEDVRREGCALDVDIFKHVVDLAAHHNNW